MNCKIDIKGLASGEHTFEFPLDGVFFESYENDMISEAALNVKVVVSKSAGWVRLELNVDGTVTVPCDRCLSDLSIPVHIEAPFTVDFSSSVSDQDDGDDVIVMEKGESEIDMSQIIYDYVCLSLPLKKVHEDGKCDPVMLEKMKDILK